MTVFEAHWPITGATLHRYTTTARHDLYDLIDEAGAVANGEPVWELTLTCRVPVTPAVSGHGSARPDDSAEAWADDHHVHPLEAA